MNQSAEEKTLEALYDDLDELEAMIVRSEEEISLYISEMDLEKLKDAYNSLAELKIDAEMIKEQIEDLEADLGD